MELSLIHISSRIPSPGQKDKITQVKSTELKKGDIVYIKAGEQIPADGDVIEGADVYKRQSWSWAAAWRAAMRPLQRPGREKR